MLKTFTAVAFAIAFPAAAVAQVAPAAQPTSAQGQACMDHSKMAGMDHSKMSGMDMSKMDHSKMSGMDMSSMDHSKMADCTAPAKPADATAHQDHNH